MKSLSAILMLALSTHQSSAFSPSSTNTARIAQRTTFTPQPSIITFPNKHLTILQMSDDEGGASGELEKENEKKMDTAIMDQTETETEEEEDIEEQYRVMLHNDEVHTFNYVIRSLQKVMGTLDKKKAFDICTVTHGQGKATIGIYWKKQAMKYCLGLQRQGLTASIAPDGNFEGGSKGGKGGKGKGGGKGGGDSGK